MHRNGKVIIKKSEDVSCVVTLVIIVHVFFNRIHKVTGKKQNMSTETDTFKNKTPCKWFNDELITRLLGGVA